MRVNGDLVGKYGNFANRTLTFIDSKVGAGAISPESYDEIDQTFLSDIERLSVEIRDSFEQFKVRQACSQIMQLATLGNVYFDQKKPWVLIKDKELKGELMTMLSCCLHCLKVMALVSYPVIPDAAQKLWNLLGIQGDMTMSNFEEEAKVVTSEQMKLKKPEILFEKIKDEVIQEEINFLKSKEKDKAKSTSLKEAISYDDFSKLDLRVGEILAAAKVPKSKKLLKFEVDLGFEKRTIVSGIAQSYPDADQLVGMKVVVVANLKPAKLMGIKSEGMILCAGADEVELLSLAKSANGDVVS